MSDIIDTNASENAPSPEKEPVPSVPDQPHTPNIPDKPEVLPPREPPGISPDQPSEAPPDRGPAESPAPLPDTIIMPPPEVTPPADRLAIDPKLLYFNHRPLSYDLSNVIDFASRAARMRAMRRNNNYV